MEPIDPNIATCPSCGTLIDVSEEEPFALVNCSSCGARMRVQQAFANFELQAMLGEGGQGRVFLAVDRTLNRPVAIKVMRREYSADPEFIRRFESEARITASLSNPHIVKVFSSGEYRGLVYLVMEVVDHGSLESRMADGQKVPVEQAIDVGIQIATGLKAGLELGLIHRDIKPGNILFSDEHTAKIVDFGLAVLVEKQAEEQGEVWATPYYVAPEKLDGQPEDFRSDMYSLAATLFHAIAGRPPFISESNSMAELRRIKSAPVHLLNFAPHVPIPLAYVIDQALSFRPDDRFASYDEFIAKLEYARAAARARPGKIRRPRVRKMGDPDRGWSWVTAATVAIVVAMGIYLWVTREVGEEKKTGNAGPGTPGQVEPDVSAGVRFDGARKQLVDGKFAAAAKTFRGLYEESRLPEPKNSWAAVHQGFAEYLAERPGPARTAFEDLAGRISPTAIGMDAQFVAFLRRLAVIAASEPKDAAGTLAGVDATSYESLAYFIAALKQWNTGNFDEAVGLLKQFQQAVPTGDSAWVGDYRTLVGRFLDDHGSYREIAAGLEKVNTEPETAAAALNRIADAKGRLRSRRLIERLEALEAESAEKVKAAVAAVKGARMKKQAEAEEREEKLLTETKYQLKTLCENYRFTEAAALVRGVNVSLEKPVSERTLLARRVDLLVEFKQQLIKDLNTSGCTLPLVRKNAQKLIGGVARAGDLQIDVRVPFGSTPIAWSDLSPQSVLQMSRFYMPPTLPPEMLADRKWRAGVFCLFTQLFNEGQILMEEAAAQKPEYQNERAIFFGQPAPAADDAAPPEVPPATGLEMADQPLNPSRNGPASGITVRPVPR